MKTDRNFPSIKKMLDMNRLLFSFLPIDANRQNRLRTYDHYYGNIRTQYCGKLLTGGYLYTFKVVTSQNLGRLPWVWVLVEEYDPTARFFKIGRGRSGFLEGAIFANKDTYSIDGKLSSECMYDLAQRTYSNELAITTMGLFQRLYSDFARFEDSRNVNFNFRAVLAQRKC